MEDSVLYPALEKMEPGLTKGFAQEHTNQGASSKSLVSLLESDGGDGSWSEKVLEFCSEDEEHMVHEEKTYGPKMPGFSGEEAKRIVSSALKAGGYSNAHYAYSMAALKAKSEGMANKFKFAVQQCSEAGTFTYAA
jgi:hypothetical protein